MTRTSLYTAQLEREAKISRRVLDRLPETLGDWKPHERSMAFGYLAFLVASMPGWATRAITADELDLNPKAGSQFRPRSDASPAELRSIHEDAVKGALDS